MELLSIPEVLNTVSGRKRGLAIHNGIRYNSQMQFQGEGKHSPTPMLLVRFFILSTAIVKS